MDNFLRKCSLPKLTSLGKKSINRSITIKETEEYIKELSPAPQIKGPIAFIEELSKNTLSPMLHTLYQSLENERKLQTTLMNQV